MKINNLIMNYKSCSAKPLNISNRNQRKLLIRKTIFNKDIIWTGEPLIFMNLIFFKSYLLIPKRALDNFFLKAVYLF